MFNVYNPPPSSETEKQKLTQDIIALMITEYEKGNYVMAGGNWGVTPLTSSTATFTIPDTSYFNRNILLPEFIPNGWNVCYDPNHPTVRSMKTPYQIGSTPVSITDFFIASPNIHVLETETIPSDFRFSNHNPVRVTFRFL
jgi:hypothetical protein